MFAPESVKFNPNKTLEFFIMHENSVAQFNRMVSLFIHLYTFSFLLRAYVTDHFFCFLICQITISANSILLDISSMSLGLEIVFCMSVLNG